MAFQRSRGSRLASDLCRDAAHASGIEGADQQDRPQRCARHGADDAGGTLPSSACEDVTQPEAAHVADPSQAAAVEGHRHRERSARHLAQLRPQGRHGGKLKFEARIKELVENLPDLAVLVEPLLIVRRVLREQIGILHRRLLAIVRDDDGVPAPDDDPRCRPGGGADLSRHRRRARPLPNSKAVGAVFGLTPSKYQSGEIDRTGGISGCGDEMMRAMLYEAAQSHVAFNEMVLAQGLGDDRSPGAAE